MSANSIARYCRCNRRLLSLSADRKSSSAVAPVNGASVLSNPDVLKYLIGRFLWTAAAQICNVAVGWLIYDLTRSAWALGLVGLAAFLPKLLLTLVAGVVADRYDRRKVVALCLAVDGAAALGLLYIALAPDPSIGLIYAMFMILGTARAFAGPANQAMAPTLAPIGQFSKVVGLASSAGQSAAIVGPALGGFLYIPGVWAPFLCAGAFFFVASALSLSIRPRRPAANSARAGFRDAFAGLAFIRKRPVLLGAISLDLMTVLLGGATALLPIIASEILHVGPLGLGLLRSMPAVGSMMLGILLAWRPIERRAGPKLFAVTVVFGLATIGLGLSTNLYLTLALLWLLGAVDVVSVVIRQTMVQSDTPDAMRGRVAAVNSLFIGASNELGEFESGATAALFGLVPAIVAGGAGAIIVAALWSILFPDLRNRDQPVLPGKGT